jgi:hypothetical protein
MIHGYDLQALPIEDRFSSLAHRYIQLSEAMASKSIGKSLHKRASSTLARMESSRPHIAPIPDRSILEITGKDAQKFLKGLTSRDVDKSPGWGYSGFLTPTVSSHFRNG